MQSLMKSVEVATVLPNLLFGETAKITRELLKENNITHVLSMSSPPFQLPGAGEVEWLVVDLKDHKETDIFSLFPVCNAFMQHCKKPERVVLVAGVFGGGNASSAVLTAFIMAANKEPYAAAAECINSVAHKAVPHAAHFVEQLELYASLGSMMGGHRPHGNAKLLQLAHAQWIASGKKELPSAYYAAHTLPVTWQGKDGSAAAVNAEHSGVMYSCNSCLHPVFHAGNIAMKAKGGGGNSTGVAFYIEPIQWMRAQRIHRLSGSIECPNCRADVGDWNWNGFPEGELQSLKANGGDGTLKPAFRIWEEKVKPCGGLAARQ